MPLRPRRAAAALRDMGMSQLDAGELAPEEARRRQPPSPEPPLDLGCVLQSGCAQPILP